MGRKRKEEKREAREGKGTEEKRKAEEIILGKLFLRHQFTPNYLLYGN